MRGRLRGLEIRNNNGEKKNDPSRLSGSEAPKGNGIAKRWRAGFQPAPKANVDCEA